MQLTARTRLRSAPSTMLYMLCQQESKFYLSISRIYQMEEHWLTILSSSPKRDLMSGTRIVNSWRYGCCGRLQNTRSFEPPPTATTPDHFSYIGRHCAILLGSLENSPFQSSFSEVALQGKNETARNEAEPSGPLDYRNKNTLCY